MLLHEGIACTKDLTHAPAAESGFQDIAAIHDRTCSYGRASLCLHGIRCQGSLRRAALSGIGRLRLRRRRTGRTRERQGLWRRRIRTIALFCSAALRHAVLSLTERQACSRMLLALAISCSWAAERPLPGENSHPACAGFWPDLERSAMLRWLHLETSVLPRISTESLPAGIRETPSDCFHERFRLTRRLSNRLVAEAVFPAEYVPAVMPDLAALPGLSIFE